jgi:hypothetical protein
MVTEWNEFKQLDLARLRAGLVFPLLVDARNVYEPEAPIRFGFLIIPRAFRYLTESQPGSKAASIGRPQNDCKGSRAA